MSSTTAADDAAAPPPTITYVTSCDLPTHWAMFRLHAFIENSTNKEHLALTLGEIADGQPVLARIHSECLTGDALFSQRCDCGAQLETALKKIASEGRGVLLYMRQEGRGIGLIGKLKAYDLQDHGADTVEANRALGFDADQRNYEVCLPMLQYLGVTQLRLMTNNPLKVESLQQVGVEVTERVALNVGVNKFNRNYLKTKAEKLGHLIDS